MSYYFEAVVVNADLPALIRALEELAVRKPDTFAPIELAVHQMAVGGFVVFGWRIGSERPQSGAEIEQLAAELSLAFGAAVAVHYDDQCEVKCALLARDGAAIQCFGEQDEIWVPYDDAGELMTDGPRYAGDVIPDDIECDCIHSGIDAALAAAGFSDWADNSKLLQVNHRAQHSKPIWQHRAP
jgi:hypothetical protein